MTSRRSLFVIALLLSGTVRAQDLDELRRTLLDATLRADQRLAALHRLHDRGELAPADHAAFLVSLRAPESAGGTDAEAVRLLLGAVRHLRHECATVPDEVALAIRSRPFLLDALLAELADAPRPAFVGLATAVMRDELLPAGQRLLASAALGPLDRAAGELALAVLADEVADATQDAMAARHALLFLPEDVADGLVGSLLQALQRGLPFERFQPFVQQLSRLGELQLLAISLQLPVTTRFAIATHLASAGSEALHERSLAVLDGAEPLESCWLLMLKGEVTTERRVRRLESLMVDEGSEPRARLIAFQLLCERGHHSTAVVERARSLGPAGVRMLLGAPAATIAESTWLLALDSEEPIVQQALLLLRNRSLTPALEARVLALLPLASLQVLDAAAAALLARGSRVAMDAAWQRLVDENRPLVEAVEWALRREDRAGLPWLVDRLGGLQDGRAAARIRIELAAAGDRAALAALAAAVDTLPFHLLRSCAQRIVPPSRADAEALVRAAQATEDPEREAVALAWAARHPDADLQRALAGQLLMAGEAAELPLDDLVPVLLQGAGRDILLAVLDKALADGDPSQLEMAVALALPAALPDPIGAEDLLRLARLALQREVPANERAHPSDFQRVAAAAERLRRMDAAAAGAACADVTAALLANAGTHPHRLPQAAQLLALWSQLAPAPEVRDAVALATAPLAAAGGEGADAESADGQARTLALVLRARAALEAGRRAEAEAAARNAARVMLRRFDGTELLRRIGQDRAVAVGVDPVAALAALPHLARACALGAAGDRDGARAAAVLTLEFAGRDLRTREQVVQLLQGL